MAVHAQMSRTKPTVSSAGHGNIARDLSYDLGRDPYLVHLAHSMATREGLPLSSVLDVLKETTH